MKRPRLVSFALPAGVLLSLGLAHAQSSVQLTTPPVIAGRVPVSAAPAAPSGNAVEPLIATCMPSLRDQANSGCIQASSVPTLGKLMPLSSLFNVTPTGEVGIGTAFPGATLDVKASGGLSIMTLDGNGGGSQRFMDSGVPVWDLYGDAVNGYRISRSGIDYPMVIDYATGNTQMNVGAGSVCIGTATPTSSFKLDVDGIVLGRQGARFYGPVSGALGNTTALSLVAGPSFAGWDFNIDEGSEPGLYFSEVNANFANLVLRRGGNVGVGTASPQELLDVAGNVRCVSLIQTSAREFKKDIAPLTGALASILKLQGVTYSWNDKAPEAVQGHEDIGFIADDVDAVLPEIVSKDENGKVLGLDYGKVTPVAVEAIKELNAKNVALEARLAKLEALLAGQTK